MGDARCYRRRGLEREGQQKVSVGRHNDWVYKEGAWSSSTRASGSAGGGPMSSILTAELEDGVRKKI